MAVSLSFRRRGARLAAFVCLISAGGGLRAQTVHPGAVDLTVGPSSGRGSAHDYTDTEGFTVALTLVPERQSAVPVAITVGVMPQLGYESRCVLTPPTHTTCAPRLPGTGYFGPATRAREDPAGVHDPGVRWARALRG